MDPSRKRDTIVLLSRGYSIFQSRYKKRILESLAKTDKILIGMAARLMIVLIDSLNEKDLFISCAVLEMLEQNTERIYEYMSDIIKQIIEKAKIEREIILGAKEYLMKINEIAPVAGCVMEVIEGISKDEPVVVEEPKCPLDQNDDLLHNPELEEYQRTLCSLVKENNSSGLIEFCKKNDVKKFYFDKLSLLHYASKNGFVDTVKTLVQLGVNLNALDKYNLTALHWAIKRGNGAVIEALLASGADPDYSDENNETLLMFATIFVSLTGVKLLLPRVSDINKADKSGFTALMRAVSIRGYRSSDKMSLIELLLSHESADINKRYADSNTLLHITSAMNDVSTVRCLLKLGADPEAQNLYGETCLHIAIENGRNDIVRLLIEKKVNLEATNSSGSTPLCRAIEVGNTTAVELLLSEKVNVHHKTREGFSVYYLGIQKSKDIAFLLRKSGAEITCIDVCDAVIRNDVESQRIMKQFDCRIVDTLRRTLLIMAYDSLDKSLHKFIGKADDKVIYTKVLSGYTPLHFAAQEGDTGMIDILLRWMPNVDVKTKKGLTPLHIAARNGHLSSVLLLLEKGANIYQTDSNNWNMHYHAGVGGNKDVIKLSRSLFGSFDAEE